MKTIVLDDDPTGTQSVTGVTVLLSSSVDDLVQVLTTEDAVYVQTNSRALTADDAVALVRRIREQGLAAAERLGTAVQFVLRGDSTLRGHVFAETEVFLDEDPDAVMLFVPAFPDGGRTTRGGVHFVRVDEQDVPAHLSEYADDPVFGFSTGVLVDYVAEKSDRTAVPIMLSDVRDGAVARVLQEAPAGAVVTPDAVTDHDVRLIADGLAAAAAAGRRVVVRSASPLAARVAGVASHGLLPTPLEHAAEEVGPTTGGSGVLLVCGSHTAGASAQLEPVVGAFGPPTVIDTVAALRDPAPAGHAAAEAAARAAAGPGVPVLVLTSERHRAPEHNTLAHGEAVMSALTTAVRDLLPRVRTVVAKGGITSADVARAGIGATRARVLGQVLPGVSVWRMAAHDGREVEYVVVPGNVGGPSTLMDVLAALGTGAGASATADPAVADTRGVTR